MKLNIEKLFYTFFYAQIKLFKNKIFLICFINTKLEIKKENKTGSEKYRTKIKLYK